MATLKVLTMECVKKQDTVGQDSIHVHVDGTHLAGPFAMGKTDVKVFSGATRDFTGSAILELIEVDGKFGGSNDESLGTVTVQEAQAGQGSIGCDFNRLSGADYHVEYEVIA
jgi:hypothetical protein